MRRVLRHNVVEQFVRLLSVCLWMFMLLVRNVSRLIMISEFVLGQNVT